MLSDAYPGLLMLLLQLMLMLLLLLLLPLHATDAVASAAFPTAVDACLYVRLPLLFQSPS